ncbi:hypothetical protein [Mangrovicoccus ximenensis]|uniref:hypothetical protein n=1 Tax=Mangrovicoccus ximenensis TaxID=1911570 RepID=UPI000D383D31|nr:hypothetical protein [Mangrovicoccus ximenensis]
MLRKKNTPKRGRLSISKHAEARHKIAGKVVCDALILGEDFDAWADAAAVLAVRLDVRERAALAWAALKSLPPEFAEMTAGAALEVPFDA